MNFEIAPYHVELTDNSASWEHHLNEFDAVYGHSGKYRFTSTQLLKLYQGENLRKQVLIGALGGGTGVYANTALLDGNRLVTCCCNTVFCVALPSLNLVWETQADGATCFRIFKYQGDYIIHGELAISRLDQDGNIVWTYGGIDIFVALDDTDSLILNEDHMIATDFEYNKYVIGYDGQTISYSPQQVL